MKLRALLLALIVTAMAPGCTPSVSTMTGYRDDAAAMTRLAERAASVCSCLRGADQLPPHPFTTDGCSASPDGDSAECCVEHDIAYWCGGSREDRRSADQRLAACIRRKGHPQNLAKLIRAVVKIGGHPRSPLPWRWAYGWSGLRGYEARSQAASADACFANPSPLALDMGGPAEDRWPR